MEMHTTGITNRTPSGQSRPPRAATATRIINAMGALAYRNDEIIQRFARRNGVALEHAQALFEETKKFLVVAAANPGLNPSPGKELDEMWHHFILHTRDYAAYCSRYLGGFIHHQPSEDFMPHGRARMICDLANATLTPYGAGINQSLWPVGNGTDCRSDGGEVDCSSDNCAATDCYSND